jgi:glucose-6-phosphate 1-dehydrogenase
MPKLDPNVRAKKSTDPAQLLDCVIFGGTGDLAMRKIFPAFYRLVADGKLAPGSRILGIARSAVERAAFQQSVRTACEHHIGSEIQAETLQKLLDVIDYQTLDANHGDDYQALADWLTSGADRIRIFFLSTAPALFDAICAQLSSHGLVSPKTRIMLEKPLGEDRASAARINDTVARIAAEHQIYRIDHYLGKETVQNLLALRFGNTLFEPLWRRGTISHVQITVAEQLGVEQRGEFYDRTGALRDMVQNHLLQLLCILAMEPPASSSADAVRDEKLKVLRALRPIGEAEALLKTARGQYRQGSIDGKTVQGYLEETGVANNSTTETFVAVKAEIDTWRWAGVPFYLRTGKRMPTTVAEIVVHFEPLPLSIFEGGFNSQAPNRLIIRLQPDESITLRVLAKKPGASMRLKPVDLSLNLAESFTARPLEAYERLLRDVIDGNLTLFMRRDEVDAAWSWIDPIRQAWDLDEDGTKGYPAGTHGPASASALIARDGYTWHDE